MTDTIHLPHTLIDRIFNFFDELRTHGFDTSTSRKIGAMRAVTALGIDDEQQFRIALRTGICKSREEQRRFDVLFDSFWHAGAQEDRRSREFPGPRPVGVAGSKPPDPLTARARSRWS